MRSIFIFILSLSILSCSTDSSEIGADFFNGGALDFSLLDSCTVSLSTVVFDKIATNNASRMLLGTHHDAKLGNIASSAYFGVTIPTTTLPDDKIEYAYTALSFQYDSYSYYDTSAVMTLHVYRLLENIKTDENGQLYSDDSFAYDPIPLGTLSFKPRPHGDSLEIQISDALGLDLYSRLREDDDATKLSDKFQKLYKGFVVIPDDVADGSLVGFETTPELRIYYHDSNVVPTRLNFISFSRIGTLYFNHVSSDRSETKLATLTSPKQKLAASTTDDQSYMQGGSGMALRVDIPYLRDLKAVTNLFVTQAVLDVYPVRKTYSGLQPLPSFLTVYQVSAKNDVSITIGTANLIPDIDLGRDTHYELDVTQFVKSQMDLEEFNENGLMFLPSTFGSAVEQGCFGNPGSEYKTNVKIYYTTVNQ